MNGGHFLVSLWEVNNTSEKNLISASILQENLNFLEKAIYSPKREVSEMVSKSTVKYESVMIRKKWHLYCTYVIAYYITKTLSNGKLCAVCKVKMIADETSIKCDECLRKLSRGGLICPSPPLRDFVFQSFRTVDYISQIIFNLTQNVLVLSNLQTDCINFKSVQYKQWGRKLTICTVVNIS